MVKGTRLTQRSGPEIPVGHRKSRTKGGVFGSGWWRENPLSRETDTLCVYREENNAYFSYLHPG